MILKSGVWRFIQATLPSLGASVASSLIGGPRPLTSIWLVQPSKAEGIPHTPIPDIPPSYENPFSSVPPRFRSPSTNPKHLWKRYSTFCRFRQKQLPHLHTIIPIHTYIRNKPITNEGRTKVKGGEEGTVGRQAETDILWACSDIKTSVSGNNLQGFLHLNAKTQVFYATACLSQSTSTEEEKDLWRKSNYYYVHKGGVFTSVPLGVLMQHSINSYSFVTSNSSLRYHVYRNFHPALPYTS